MKKNPATTDYKPTLGDCGSLHSTCTKQSNKKKRPTRKKARTHLLDRNILSTLSIPDIPHTPSGNRITTVLARARHIHRPHEPLEPLNVHPILLREPPRLHSIVPSTTSAT